MLLLKDLKKSFRQPDGTALPVLDIPEFRVAAGEQMVLVGRSGCGKTTLLHVIAGISRPDSGKVRIDDWDITLMPEAECDRFRAERIGYVFQTFNLLAGFTALENVLVAMRFARGRPDKARAQTAAGPRRAEPPHDPPAGATLGGRAAAGGRGPGAGQQAPTPAGRRADGQRRRRPPAADPRPDPRDVPGRERGADHGHPFQRSGRSSSRAWITGGRSIRSALASLRNRKAADPNRQSPNP